MTINARTVNRLFWSAPGAQTPRKAGRVPRPYAAAASPLLLAPSSLFFPFFCGHLHTPFSETAGRRRSFTRWTVVFYFLLGPPLRSLVCQESFSLTPAVGPSNQTQLSHRHGCTPDVLSGLIKHTEPTPLTPVLPAATFLHWWSTSLYRMTHFENIDVTTCWSSLKTLFCLDSLKWVARTSPLPNLSTWWNQFITLERKQCHH